MTNSTNFSHEPTQDVCEQSQSDSAPLVSSDRRTFLQGAAATAVSGAESD